MIVNETTINPSSNKVFFSNYKQPYGLQLKKNTTIVQSDMKGIDIKNIINSIEKTKGLINKKNSFTKKQIRQLLNYRLPDYGQGHKECGGV